MLKKHDKVRYKSDGMKAGVVDAQPRMITLVLTNGERAHLHPDDAAKVLEVWRGDPKTGKWAPLS